jgi:NhaP-type Na+/H+ or K+/H+ antiporter
VDGWDGWDSAARVLESLAGMSPGAYMALVIVLAVVCQWAAWKWNVPSILGLLLVGFGLGQVVRPEEVLGRDVLFGGVSLTVGIILFEGSLSLRIRQVTDLRRPVARLCTVTVLIAWMLITGTALLVGFDPAVALLVGAILVVTGPTVIAPILRSLRPTRRVSNLLRWEGIIVDPIGAVLAVLVFQAILAGSVDEALPAVALSLLRTAVVGFGIAIALAAALEWLMRRHAIPDFLHGVVLLGAAVGALFLSNLLQEESGLLTVTVLGVILGNRPELHLEHVREFKEHLQVLLVGALFVVLAGRVTPQQLYDVLPQALLFLVALVLVVRPVSVGLGLLGTNVTREERTLLACMAPRGIVAAAVTSIFALELGHAADRLTERAADATGATATTLAAQADELARLSTEAEQLVPLVFILIVCTVTIYGFGVGRLAERLHLASTSPQGVLFAGTSRWVVDAARLLEEHRVPTLIVAREYRTLAKARMAGLTTETANILSEYAVKDMNLAGIGSLLACSPDDETNATAAREFTSVLGRAHVFALRRGDPPGATGDAKRDTAGHLTARTPFVPALSYGELEDRLDAGMRVAAVALTPERTLADLERQYADHGGVVAMFSVRAGQTQVLHEGARLPQHGVTLIALLPGEIRTEPGAEAGAGTGAHAGAEDRGEVLSQVPPTA